MPDSEIDEFQKFGQIGWAFFAGQLLQGSNQNLVDHIREKYRTQKLRKRVFELDDNKSHAAIKLELIRRDKAFLAALLEIEDEAEFEVLMNKVLGKHYQLNKKGKKGQQHHLQGDDRGSAKRRQPTLLEPRPGSEEARDGREHVVSGASL